MLMLNREKTIIMINSKKKRLKKIEIHFNNDILKHTEKFIILGLVYNDKLNFFNHLKMVQADQIHGAGQPNKWCRLNKLLCRLTK